MGTIHLMRRPAPLLLAAVLAGLSSVTFAGLNIDLRATRLNGEPLSGANSPKHIFSVLPGDIVSFDIFAVITGSNGSLTDDRFISVSGSLRSTVGGVLGHIAGDLVRSVTDPDTGEILVAGFDAPFSSVGLQQDLDADGDLDVGSNIDSQPENFWAPRYALAATGAGATAGSLSPTTGGRLVGFGTFLVTAPTVGSTTAINFDGRTETAAANYIQDDVLIQQPSVDGIVPLLITIPGVPEPSTLALLTFAAAPVLRQRRSVKR